MIIPFSFLAIKGFVFYMPFFPHSNPFLEMDMEAWISIQF